MNPNPGNCENHIYVQVHHRPIEGTVVLPGLFGIHNQASHQEEQKAKINNPRKLPAKLRGATHSQCRPKPLPRQASTADSRESTIIPPKSIEFPPNAQIFYIILYFSKGNKCKFPCSGVEIA
jgi:hypothetical protein